MTKIVAQMAKITLQAQNVAGQLGSCRGCGKSREIASLSGFDLKFEKKENISM